MISKLFFCIEYLRNMSGIWLALLVEDMLQTPATA